MNNYGLVMSNVCLPDTGEMMGHGRPLKVLRLSDAEREELSRWTRRARTGQALALRARIVLDCASGKPTPKLPQRAASPSRWWVNGVRAFSSGELKDCLMSPSGKAAQPG